MNEIENWNFACSLSDLRASHREIMIGSNVIAVFLTSEGVFAVDAMCAHQGGPLAQGKLNGKCLTCPWHGWQYNVTSGTNMLTGRKMLATYRVEVRGEEGGEEVWIGLPS